MSTSRFYRRRFLNRRGHHAGAYVLADCQLDAYRPKDRPATYAVDAVLTVADCGRVATLDFAVHSEASARNALYKARLLRDVVVEFITALEAAGDEWSERSVN